MSEDNLNEYKKIYRKFDFTTYLKRVPNPNICLIAKRGSGKSTLVKELIYRFSDIPAGIVISYTEDVNPFYKHFFPDSFIYTKFTKELFEKVFLRQQRLKEKKEKKKNIDTRCLIVMDDCMGNKNDWKNDEEFDKLMANGRHFDLTYILTLQYPVAIKPDTRENFDLVIIFYTNKYDAKQKISKYFVGIFEKYKEFDKVFTGLTENYGAMIIVSRGAESNKIRDQIFWYTVDYEKLTKSTQNFMFGCNQLKQFHENNKK